MLKLFETISQRPGYFSIVAVVSIGVGIGSYLAAGKIKEKLDERKALKDENASDETNPRDIEWEEAEFDGYERVIVNEEYSKPSLVDYTKFFMGDKKEVERSAEATSIPSETLPEVPPAENEIDSEQEISSPSFIISEKDYLDTSLPGYAKADGTFFTEDDILAGWNDKLNIQDPRRTIGEDIFKMMKDGNWNTVYVRNPELKVDYQITKTDSSYDDAVAELAGDI